MHKVLLIEDSKEIFTMVKQALGTFVELTWADTIEKAEKEISSHSFDFFLVDIELPDGNGIEFCTKVRSENPQTPIFFLTSHTELSEKVMGFSAGGDDYIVKPFAPLELKARVEAALRRSDMSKHASDLMKWDEIEINKNRQEVMVLTDGELKKIDLTALEFKLLIYFANKPGDVIPRDQVLNDIWGEDVHVYPRSVDTHVSKLRKKLGPVSHVIESVHGSGYKFNPTAQ